MAKAITRVAVIGAGVMGAGIAAHLANAGLQVLLLDIVPDELLPEEAAKGLTLSDYSVRNRLASSAKERMLKAKPPILFVKKNSGMISVGNLEDDLPKLTSVDWVIEATIERLDVKQSLVRKLGAICRPGTIISSNTSGLSINEIVAGESLPIRQHFLGTHFFNPPRYMKLLEIIPGKDTLPEVTEYMSDFAKKTLGKGVVLAKDKPNFIANRIGVYSNTGIMKAMVDFGLTVEEVDAITGPALGRPKSATLRTTDMVGLDLALLVADNLGACLPDKAEKEAFSLPDFMKTMVAKKMLGDKSKQGFYKKVVTNGKKETLVFDYKAMEYRAQRPVSFASLDAATQQSKLPDKLRTLIFADDVAGKFAWRVMREMLVYSAEHAMEIAYNIPDVDNALKWGFNWALGPFEIWDAIGVEKVADRLKGEGQEVPALVQKLLEDGNKSFYRNTSKGREFYEVGSGSYSLIKESSINSLLSKLPVITASPSAKFVDLGDDVACLALTGNVIGEDFPNMLEAAIDSVENNSKALVIASTGSNFSNGIDISWLSAKIEENNWIVIESFVQDLQRALMKLKYCTKPVVAAISGNAKGIGLEIILHSHHVRATADTFIGSPDLLTGLTPMGGGLKEMTIRCVESIPSDMDIDLYPFFKKTHERICMAFVSGNAAEAKESGYLRNCDKVTMNQDDLIQDAKKSALWLSEMGYLPPSPSIIRIAGKPGYAAIQMGTDFLLNGGFITEFSAKLGSQVASVMTGGDLPDKSTVSEQYLLDLERETFMRLCREPKTLERIRHMLTTKRPLLN